MIFRRAFIAAGLCSFLGACSAILGIGDLRSAADTTTQDGSTASEAGTGEGGTQNEGGEPAENAPRLLSPLSTSHVSSRTPTLKWSLPTGVTAVTVDICTTRDCKTPVPGSPFSVTGSSFRPPTQLSAGVKFWRVHPAGDPSLTSATWEFWAGVGNPNVDTSWGTVLDVNGDGFADLAVGAPVDHANAIPGLFAIYHGSPAGISSPPTTLVTGPDGLGSTVASAGDINGDGYGDLIVGLSDPGAVNDGGAYIYLGGPGGINATPLATLATSHRNGRFAGAPARSIGDINADGYGDVGIWAGPPIQRDAGYVPGLLIYFGGPKGLSATLVDGGADPDKILVSPTSATNDAFGFAFASPGDLDRDGISDLAVSAPSLRDDAGNDVGAVYLYRGGASALGGPPFQTLPAPGGFVEFGVEVAGAGDFTGDGLPDLLITSNMGTVRSFNGASDGGVHTYFEFSETDGGPGVVYRSAAATGDINGDGANDFVLASTNSSLVVFIGGNALATEIAPQRVYPPVDSFTAISGAGDLNGDGFADFVAGGMDAAQNYYVYVFYGSASGLVLAPDGGVPANGVVLPPTNAHAFGYSLFGATN